MVFTLFNVVYVLIAVAMIALILLQRGAGAQAGSGFGGGASATVFGARGAANFLSRSTAILAGVFFLLSLIMGIYLHPVATKQEADLGVMSGYQTPEAPKPATPASSDVPSATPAPTTVPTTATPASDVPAPAAAAPVQSTPAPAADKPAATQPPAATDKKTDAKKKGGKPADKNSH
jgi:preprotein translocase subunit SecG